MKIIQDGSWLQEPGDKYVVTGVDTTGRRFSITCGSWFYARGVNVWRGTKWLKRDGRRSLICRVSN